MSMANDAVWLPETAQTSPTITTTEVVTKVPAFGGIGGAQAKLSKRAGAFFYTWAHILSYI